MEAIITAMLWLLGILFLFIALLVAAVIIGEKSGFEMNELFKCSSINKKDKRNENM